MLLEYVDPDNCMIEIRIGRLDNLVMLMFSVFDTIQSLKHKLKEGTQVFRGWTCHKYIRIPRDRHTYTEQKAMNVVTQ